MLDAQALNIRINSNMHLIEVVRPYMERLYSIVKGSDFYLLFCDKDGYILDLIGDESMILHGKNKSMLVAGANRQESIAGTNAIGTCLKLKAPIQIWGGPSTTWSLTRDTPAPELLFLILLATYSAA